MITNGSQPDQLGHPATGSDPDFGEEPIVFETLSSSDEAAAPVPALAAAPAAVPQGWLNKFGRSAPSPARQFPPQPAPPRIVVVLEEEQPLPWPQRLREWFWGPNGFSTALALAVHALLLSGMGFVILDQQREEPLLEIFSIMDEEELEDFVEVGVLGEVFNEGGDSAQEIAQTLVNELPNPEQELQALNPADVDVLGGLQALEGTGRGNGDGPGVDISAIPGRNAVAKGSFTAWTKPEDPRPQEDYVLFLRIKVGDDVKKLPLTDLAGSSVIGTDSFRLRIPLDLKFVTFLADNGNVMSHEPIGQNSQLVDKSVDVQEGFVTLRVIIPGGQNLVKDTIQVHSRILKEKQTLEIEF